MGPTYANIGQHRPNIGRPRPNIGSTWAQDVPNIDHMGATWPNLGPRCAPDSLTLLNIGPTKSQRERERGGERERERERERDRGEREREGGPSPAHTQTQIGRRPAVRRKPHKSTRTFPCRRPSVGNRRLYTLAAPAADPFVGPRVYPVSTPGRPQVKSGRQIYMYLVQDVQKMFRNIAFYSVSWPSADTTFA